MNNINYDDEQSDVKSDIILDSVEDDLMYALIIFLQQNKNNLQSRGIDIINKIEAIDLLEYIYSII